MPKMPVDECQKRRKQRALRKKFLSTFTAMGFVHYQTDHKQFQLGGRDMELDSIFVYENLILLGEDTIDKGHDHLRTKDDTMQRILANVNTFLQIMDDRIDGFHKAHERFDNETLKLFYIHVCEEKDYYSWDEITEFPHIKLWGKNNIDYFKLLSESIHLSARFELFRHLGISKSEIGPARATVPVSNAKTPIIYPKNYIGPIQDCRVVTFMLSAEELIERSYVLRKEGWEKRTRLYQRLIDKTKMQQIRDYIVQNQSSFLNNIIVALPKETHIIDSRNRSYSIFDSPPYKQNEGLYLSLPAEYNSICIIDGQHRVFAYHEGGIHDEIVERLRKERHLLVTGVMFPPSMEDGERLKLQSQIFLDINKNAKPIAPDLLIYIQKLQNPLKDTSIAQDVLDAMNEHGVFKDQFQKTTLSSRGIKTASIIKFALRYVVSIDNFDNRESLFYYWDGDRDALGKHNLDARAAYISFCSEKLSLYFAGVKQAWNSYWNENVHDSLLPSVVTINGCLLAYKRQLAKNGLKDIDFYKKAFQKWKTGFSKQDFAYRSSQYGRFAKDILQDVFEIENPQ